MRRTAEQRHKHGRRNPETLESCKIGKRPPRAGRHEPTWRCGNGASRGSVKPADRNGVPLSSGGRYRAKSRINARRTLGLGSADAPHLNPVRHHPSDRPLMLLPRVPRLHQINHFHIGSHTRPRSCTYDECSFPNSVPQAGQRLCDEGQHPILWGTVFLAAYKRLGLGVGIILMFAYAVLDLMCRMHLWCLAALVASSGLPKPRLYALSPVETSSGLYVCITCMSEGKGNRTPDHRTTGKGWRGCTEPAVSARRKILTPATLTVCNEFRRPAGQAGCVAALGIPDEVEANVHLLSWEQQQTTSTTIGEAEQFGNILEKAGTNKIRPTPRRIRTRSDWLGVARVRGSRALGPIACAEEAKFRGAIRNKAQQTRRDTP